MIIIRTITASARYVPVSPHSTQTGTGRYFQMNVFQGLYVHPFQSPINRNPLRTPSNVKHSEPELDVPGFICEGVPHFHCQLALTRSCFTSVRMSRLVKIKITAHSRVGFFFFPPPQSHRDFHGTHQRIWGRVHAGSQAYKRGKKRGWRVGANELIET